MPYDLSLQAFALAEWFTLPPDEWERRLREISPKSDHQTWLRFRYRAPQPDWLCKDRGMWELYACTPRRMVTADRAEQFRLHWSELPKEQQAGRKAFVSNYQHFLWHSEGVDAKRFWVLQGPWGGTPAAYSRREERYLDAAGAISEPYPLGFFPPSPFNERAVRLILERDRLVQAGNNLDALEKADRPDALKAEDEAAEKAFRTKFLDTTWETMQPQAEFMKSQKAKEELAGLDLPTQTRAQADASATWKDHFLEYGCMPGATNATAQKIQVAVR